MDELLSKKNANELAEEIDATGQESETKAVKWVQEVEKRNQQEQTKQEANEQDILHKKRRYKKNDYFQSLLTMAQRRLAEYDIPKEYATSVQLRDNKLIFGLCKIGYRWYAKGMTICGEPTYDINCVERLVIQTMLSLDELQEQHEHHRTKSGIILPAR